MAVHVRADPSWKVPYPWAVDISHIKAWIGIHIEDFVMYVLLFARNI